MKTLEISGGIVKLDDHNYEHVKDFGGWYIDSRGYAITDKRILGKRTIIDMHRFIHPSTKGYVVDHRNQDKLDNQESNLRDATKSINALNSKLPSTNRSGYKGVTRIGVRWRAALVLDGRQLHLGYFDDAEEASRKYQDKLAEVLSA